MSWLNLTRGVWGLAPDVMAEPYQRGERMNLTREPWGLAPDVMAEPYQRGERTCTRCLGVLIRLCKKDVL